MMKDWQTWVALAVVAVAAMLMVRSWLKSHKGKSCGQGCGCPLADKNIHTKNATTQNAGKWPK